MFNVVFNPVQKGETSQVLNSLGLTFHLILGTNVLSIGLIAWKSWCALLASNWLNRLQGLVRSARVRFPTTSISDYAVGIGNAASQ